MISDDYSQPLNALNVFGPAFRSFAGVSAPGYSRGSAAVK